jgi:hypothetical protein
MGRCRFLLLRTVQIRAQIQRWTASAVSAAVALKQILACGARACTMLRSLSKSSRHSGARSPVPSMTQSNGRESRCCATTVSAVSPRSTRHWFHVMSELTQAIELHFSECFDLIRGDTRKCLQIRMDRIKAQGQYTLLHFFGPYEWWSSVMACPRTVKATSEFMIGTNSRAHSAVNT